MQEDALHYKERNVKQAIDLLMPSACKQALLLIMLLNVKSKKSSSSMKLNLVTEILLHQLEEEGAIEDAKNGDKKLKLLNLERPTAELIYFLILGFQRKRILEIGTSHGYSSLWFAQALLQVKESQLLVTIERELEKVQKAQQNFLRAGVSEKIKILQGDATTVVATLEGTFDCVFFDADRLSAPEQLHLLLPKLEQNVLLLTDNVLSHPAEVAAYLMEFEKLPEFKTIIVPVGKGLHIAYRY